MALALARISILVALFAIFVSESAQAQVRLHDRDGWTVDRLIVGGTTACLVRASYPSGERVSILLTRGPSWPATINRPTGFQPGQKRLFTLVVDRDLLHEALAHVDDQGIIRFDLPATDRTLRELADGKALEVRSSLGGTRFSLTGARAAISTGRECMLADGSASGRTPEVAGYEGSDASDPERRARMELQEALIWAGYYDGMIDGDLGPRTRAAIQGFQSAIGGDTGRVPTSSDIGRLFRLAENEKRKAGFTIVRDDRAKVAIGLPTLYAPRTTPNARGTKYTSADGTLQIDTLRFAPGERTLSSLFEQISKRGPITFLDYAKPPRDRDFVVTGRDHEKHYYFKAMEASDGIFAFSVAHSYASREQMNRVVVAMSNYFMPLSLLRPTPRDGERAHGQPDASTAAPAQRENGPSSGTGFIVSSSGHILTNAHVIDGCTRVSVSLVGQAAASARVAAADKINDLALLEARLSAPTLPSFRIGPRTGEAVNVFGFPLAGLLSTSGNFTTGNVTATSGLVNDSRMLQISAPIQPGNSGGPLLDQSGQVIGVIVSKLNVVKAMPITGDVAQNINFAIKSLSALNFLEANGVKVQIGSDLVAKPPADIADLAKQFTVFIRCE